MSKKNEYEVNEAVSKGKFKKCLICNKRFKVGEKIVLVPIQEPTTGWTSIMCIPVHSKCYWVKK
ncbi:MAG: hypothetical protein ACTSXD_11725 [Candidatus Heimdallarchaeaceae archaeon]